MSNKNVTSKTARVAARLPLDLVAWIDAQAGTRTDVVEAAVRGMRESAKPTAMPAAPFGALMKRQPAKESA